MNDHRSPLEALEADVAAAHEVEEIILDWFTFDAARRWMDPSWDLGGTLRGPNRTGPVLNLSGQ